MGAGIHVCNGHIVCRPDINQVIVVLGSSNHQGPHLYVYAARETAAATRVTCNFAVHLLATSKDNGTFIEGYYLNDTLPIPGPTLSCFF
jgi:hypothetical protein